VNRRTLSLAARPPRFTRQGSGLVLVVSGGPDDGLCAAVTDEPVVVGCAEPCQLVLSDATVSRRHLEAVRRGQALEIADLGSKNGVFVGGERVERATLQAGDEFRAGKTTIVVVPSEEEVDPEPAAGSALGGLVGSSAAMRKLFALIERVASTRAAVLIEGETGAGKELVAEEIHRRSPRRDQPFSIFDCGAVPDELIESTLFGHVKGAFTGATSDRAGVLGGADGGTVFLDEIGELRLDLQPALLRVLDRGMIRPVGATSYRDIDVRVVAATHRNLGDLIAGGGFRADLYYRLAVVRLTVPPLRERPEDIPVLVSHFAGRLGRPDIEVGEELLARLAAHPFPGNVRELRNLVERCLALSPGGRLDLEALEAAGGLSDPFAAPAARVAPPPGPRRPFREAKAEAVESFERSYLTDLARDFSNLSAAAEAAGMDRKHLRTLLRRYGLEI
jgi:DNA-binding NtrC family response regulator